MLNIEPNSPNSFTILWPDSAGNFQLEYSDALGGTWHEVTEQPQHLNGYYALNLPANAQTRFYRLRKL